MPSLKLWLILITLVAVVSDTMLLPFYPQFFERVFAITDPNVVGYYIAACCAVVMLSFPLWARVARRVEILRLLVVTQLAAGTLSVLCAHAGDPVLFWCLSLAMLMFKGSYLLIYPLLMRQEKPDQHGRTIGLLSVLVHFGAIFGAVLGGAVLQWLEPRQVYLAMALGDLFQTGVCLYLLRAGVSTDDDREAPGAEAVQPLPWRPISRLGLVMFLFYFSAYLARPFFVRYWEQLSGLGSEMLSGLVFAVPGFIALTALWLDYRRRHDAGLAVIVPALWLCGAGLLLQGSGELVTVMAGRCLYGWGLFRATVGLDRQLYAISTPASYASDFSKISVCQNLGVLASSFAAGALVAGIGPSVTFMVAGFGILATALLYPVLCRAFSERGDAMPVLSSSVARSES